MGEMIKSSNQENKKVRKIFVLFMISTGVLRVLITANLPILAQPDAGFDDGLMLTITTNLARGNWLGDYNYITLVKGPFFPFFLLFCFVSGISFLAAETILYVLGCMFFCMAIRKMFSSYKPLYIIYIILLGNPVMVSSEAFQRVYRNGIVMGLELFVLGAFVAVFLNYQADIRTWLKWMCVGSLAFVAMWYTRDDSIWIAPFMIVAMLVIAGMVAKREGVKNKTFIKKMFVLLLPAIVYGICTVGISGINYREYGIFTVTDTSGTNFSKTIQLMYSVKNEEEIPYVSVSREKMERFYKVSPTLETIQDAMDSRMNYWNGNGRNPYDGEVEDGWFYWCLRQSVQDCGYYSDANTSEEFYGKVYDELKQAIDNGEFEIRSSMPSALMSPWRKGYFGELMQTMKFANNYVLNFEGIGIADGNIASSAQENSSIEIVETITHNRAIYPNIDDDTLYSKYVNVMVAILYKIINCYKKCNNFIYTFSLVAFALLLLKTIIGVFHKNYEMVPMCIIITGFVLSYCVFLAGVSYTHISAFGTIMYMYLSSAYPLLLAIEGILVMWGVQQLWTVRKVFAK